MIIREIEREDFSELFELYTHLHEKTIPQNTDDLEKLIDDIMSDENYHIILCEVDGKIVSSVSCIVIKNLTRGLRPYALVENVVTDEKYRGRGYASACLEYAYNISKNAGCYKIFLMTGSKNESTLNFYKRAGYNDTDKTAFIRWIE